MAVAIVRGPLRRIVGDNRRHALQPAWQGEIGELLEIEGSRRIGKSVLKGVDGTTTSQQIRHRR
jgi:hypothetical protein